MHDHVEDADRKAPTKYDQSLSSSNDLRDESPASSKQDGIIMDWTKAEERRVVYKLDAVVMSVLILAFFCMQMDRGNIGNALNNGFFEDVGINQAQFNIGQQLLYVGIVVLELPSNLILYRIGPRWWLGGEVIAWGLVETFQAFQNNKSSYYATRFFLGLCEAGFIPAGLYCLSLWYKRNETSKRFTIFFFGNLIAQGSSGLLAYGIFRMDGLQGLHGWQWMFILEGIFTVCCGIILIMFLPEYPGNPTGLLGIKYFTAREREIIVKRVLLDDPSKEKTSTHVTLKQLGNALSTWRIYPHVLVSMCGIGCVSTWQQYAPKLVAGYGYSQLKANAMVSIGNWLQIPISLMLGIIADSFSRRGIALFIGILGVWAFVIGDLIVHAPTENLTTKFALLTMTLAFSSTWQPINGAWVSINASNPAERSVNLAVFVMFTNVGGIWGSQLFQPSDRAGGYKTGWSAILGVETVALVAVIFLNVMYRFLNRNRSARVAQDQVVGGVRYKFWL